MGLCPQQLVDRLAEIFGDRSDDEIDNAVAETKSRRTAEAKNKKKQELNQLFDNQIKTLKALGTPEVIVSAFERQRSEVIAKASEMTFAEGEIPFLPVIPTSYRSILDQVTMVRHGSQVGYTYLEPSEITDLVETPKAPYYIYGVEDGEKMRGKSPENAEKAIKRQSGRRGLAAVEVISLGVHTDVLSRHYVDAVGSRFEAKPCPDLWLSYDGRPELFYCWPDGASDGWGAASARSV